jgi:prefoldin subunit 4
LDEADGEIPYQIGESFVFFNAEETNERLDYSKQKIQAALDHLQERIAEIQKKHDQLKQSLYSKFGDNIGLETED